MGYSSIEACFEFSLICTELTLSEELIEGLAQYQDRKLLVMTEKYDSRDAFPELGNHARKNSANF